MGKFLTTDLFIEKAIVKHGNKYDYSKVEYKGAYIDVIITCPIHGEFKQKPYMHLFGQGCRSCGYDRVKVKNSITQEEFIHRAREIHKDLYDYSEVVYKSAKEKVKIKCNRCGRYFYQAPHNHLQGQGCYKCEKKRVALSQRKTKEDFVKRARSVHGDTYDYSKVVYITNHDKVEIICPKHGSFWQDPSRHYRGEGCPKCCRSVGETKITRFLEKSNINFIPQYKLEDCRNKLPLPFDFAIFNEDGSLRCLIEYQGKQHFEPRSKFGGIKAFEYIVTNDKIKRDYCKRNNIKLYIISYKEDLIKKLEEIKEC